MSNIPDDMRTGLKLKLLVEHQNKYPADIMGQQKHFGALPGKHNDFEEHLQMTYTEQELRQLRDSINSVLGDESDENHWRLVS